MATRGVPRDLATAIVYLPDPAIDIEKSTNGVDADFPVGPVVDMGDSITWEYVITNTGVDTLSNIVVTDNMVGTIVLPNTTLEPGDFMIATNLSTATVYGQYSNLATVDGDFVGIPVTDNDPSHYYVFEPKPAIDIEKHTNGYDADYPNGPKLAMGATITWEYIVTNIGDVELTNIVVIEYNGADFARVAFTETSIMYAGAYVIIFSTDSGATWTTVYTAPTGNSTDKHALTIGSDDKFYAQDESGQVKVFDIGSKSFSNIGVKPGGYNAQYGYNQALLFKDNLFVTGEFNGQTSTDNGATWHRSLNGYWTGQADDGTYIHSDHHGMGLLDGQYEFWSVNDGGLSFINYSSINDTKPSITYKSNGVVVTQLYDVAITPNLSTGNYVTANQDNDGFSKEMHNGSMQWIAASAGDGISAVINYNNPSIRYLGSQNGGLTKVNNGFSGKYDGDSWGQINGAAFVWPLEIHTTDPTILFAGGDDVYKIIDPNAAADLGTSITNAINLNSGAGQITKISTHGAGIAVVGETASKLSVNSGTTWTAITNPAGETINSVDFDQANMATVYATVSGYSDGNKVFKSTDSGATWTNISTGLPNIVMKEVVLKQNAGIEILFVATELGVYSKYGSGNWKKLGTALPNVIVNDIDINYTEDKLVAATFGRGLWHINIANSTLGVEKTALNVSPFSAYPSPVLDGKLNFKVEQASANFEYKIYNVLGGVVAEGKKDSNSGTINVSKLQTGIYMLKAYKDGVVFPTVKFLVSNK